MSNARIPDPKVTAALFKTGRVIPENEIVGVSGGLRYLLILDINGAFYRFADRAVTVLDRSGAEHKFFGGLATPNVSWGLERNGPAPRTIALTLDAKPGPELTWAAIDASGVDLEGARGVLLEWVEGLILERARPVIRGFLSKPLHSVPGKLDQLNVSLEEIIWNDRTLLMPPSARVSEQTFPTRVGFDSFTPLGPTGPRPTFQIGPAAGATYQFVVGRPGSAEFFENFDGPIVPGSPGYLVEFNPLADQNSHWIQIAGSHVHATVVTCYDLTEGRKAIFTVLNTFDKLGQPIAVIRPELNLPGSNYYRTFVVDPTHTYWIGWDQGGGGIREPEGTEDLRGAGDLLLFLFERMRTESNLAVDVGRIQAQIDFLNLWKLDGYINSPMTVANFIQSYLLPILPIDLVESPSGWYFRVWKFNATKEDVTHVLNADTRRVRRLTGIKRSSPASAIRNRISLEYAVSADSGVFLRRRTITGDERERFPIPGNQNVIDRNVLLDYRAAFSQNRYGKQDRTIQSRFIVADDTAELTCQWLIWENAFSGRALSYLAPPEFAEVEAGDVVEIIDSEVSMNRQLAQVDTPRHRGQDIILDCVLLENPIANLRGN